MKPAKFNSPFIMLLILSSVLLVLGGASQAFAQKYQPREDEEWITYKNPSFGYRLFYPSAIFAPRGAEDDEDRERAEETGDVDSTASLGGEENKNDKDLASANAKGLEIENEVEAGDVAEAETEEPDDDDGGSLTLLSTDGHAKIVVFGALNSENLSPREYRKTLLEEFGGYDKLDYQPVGKTWFVLSGYRGDNIYYQKVLFSCSNRVVNVFSVNFPTVEKPFYERLIEIMEDNFKTGRGESTPDGC
jgi:hypothetical protein